MGDLFSGCNVACDSKETQLGSRNQGASPSAGKNTRIVLVPCWAWKCIPAAISDGEDISKVPGCHLLWQMSSQWDSKKLLQRLVSHELTAYLSVFNLLLTQWIMVILSKGYKPDNFEPQNSLKLSFTNFWGLCSNSVEYESFLESDSPAVLTLCETKLGWLNWFWQFLCEGWFFFNLQKINYLYAWSCSLTESGTSFCSGLISRKLCGLLLMFSLVLHHSVSYFFFPYLSLSSLLCSVFDSISSNIDEVLSVNPSANAFVFGDFNICHKANLFWWNW